MTYSNNFAVAFAYTIQRTHAPTPLSIFFFCFYCSNFLRILKSYAEKLSMCVTSKRTSIYKAEPEGKESKWQEERRNAFLLLRFRIHPVLIDKFFVKKLLND